MSSTLFGVWNSSSWVLFLPASQEKHGQGRGVVRSAALDTKQGVCRLPRRKEEGGRGEEEGTEERACRARGRESCAPRPHPAALAPLWGAPHTQLGPLRGPSLKNWREQQHFFWHKCQTGFQEKWILGLAGPFNCPVTLLKGLQIPNL